MDHSSSVVNCIRLSAFAKLPTTSTDFSAGYDLYSAYDYIVKSKERILVKTDISLSIPKKCYGRIAPRSGLSLYYCIDIGGGVIDEDYRGNIGVIFINNGKNTFNIKRGDRVAQIIFEKVEYPKIKEVKCLDGTNRDNNGFGSSGIL
uniref:Deoxyuridine 5'-triphosphate nucleotidohydrolase n=1 Tax=Lumpy skin disease virus TaxID=59509 RepID=Q91T34_LSDV|nr:dUTPase [Lumpy skin disease virus]